MRISAKTQDQIRQVMEERVEVTRMELVNDEAELIATGSAAYVVG